VSAAYTQGAYDDEAALAAFARQVAVVTYEFENVAAAPLAAITPHAALFPPARALEVAQDRVNEKSFVEALGGTPAPWLAVDSAADLARAVETIGAPGILKTRRDGYDGKGQWRIMAPADAPGWTCPPCR
jgi:5-(carboxyamino)imidazole ribonucleotide synthase